MATVVKEVHLKEKGISAPSTPRRILLSHGGQTTADHSPNGDIPMAKEKPKPNYLKPTISSCHDTSCGYPKSQQQQHADQGSIAAAGARKRLISVKSMEKPAINITSSLKERTTSRTDLISLKAPRVGKALARAKSFPKSMPKRRVDEANGTPHSTTSTTAIKPAEQEEKVIFVDSGVLQGHAARHGSQAKSNTTTTEGKHRTSRPDQESDTTGKPRALPPGKVPKKVKFLRGRERQGDGKEAVAKRLKFKQREKGVLAVAAGEEKPEQENVVLKRPEVKEKDEPPAYNDVIEETAAKLATRRNKVRALVGAFESVISLQEPETTQPSQRQQVAAVKVGSGQPAQLKPEDKEGAGAERGQPAARAKPEKEVKVAGVLECYGRGEQQPEEKGEMKGCDQSVQENQPTETEEEEEISHVIRMGEGERGPGN